MGISDISFNQPKDWGKWRGYNKPKWGKFRKFSNIVQQKRGYHADIAIQNVDHTPKHDENLQIGKVVYQDVVGTQKMLVMERHNPWKYLVSSIFKLPSGNLT